MNLKCFILSRRRNLHLLISQCMICYNNVKGVVHVSIALCHWFFAIDSFMEPDSHMKRGFCVKVWLHEAIQLKHW